MYTVFRILHIYEICGSHSGVSEDPSRLCWRCVVCEWFQTFRTGVLWSIETSGITHQTTQRIIPENTNPQFTASLHVSVSSTEYSSLRSYINILSSDTQSHPGRLELPVTRLWGLNIFTNLEFLALHPAEMRFRCESPTLSPSYIWRVSDSLVWSSCGMLASRGERNKRGEMPDPMLLYPH
jgi:hypothetical protein